MNASTLFEEITDTLTLLAAYDRVEENHDAPGVDGQKVEENETTSM
ncbi:MAG: hypothetical protein ACREA0_00625 [bacterium]